MNKWVKNTICIFTVVTMILTSCKVQKVEAFAEAAAVTAISSFIISLAVDIVTGEAAENTQSVIDYINTTKDNIIAGYENFAEYTVPAFNNYIGSFFADYESPEALQAKAAIQAANNAYGAHQVDCVVTRDRMSASFTAYQAMLNDGIADYAGLDQNTFVSTRYDLGKFIREIMSNSDNYVITENPFSNLVGYKGLYISKFDFNSNLTDYNRSKIYLGCYDRTTQKYYYPRDDYKNFYGFTLGFSYINSIQMCSNAPYFFISNDVINIGYASGGWDPDLFNNIYFSLSKLKFISGKIYADVKLNSPYVGWSALGALSQTENSNTLIFSDTFKDKCGVSLVDYTNADFFVLEFEGTGTNQLDTITSKITYNKEIVPISVSSAGTSDLEKAVGYTGQLAGADKAEDINPTITYIPTSTTADDGTVTRGVSVSVDDTLVQDIPYEKTVNDLNLDIDTPSVITDKFPFSLPFDVYNIFNLLSAQPEAPKFEIPLKSDELGINENINIDLSEYNWIAEIVRWFLYIAFLVGLALITNKLIGRG